MQAKVGKHKSRTCRISRTANVAVGSCVTSNAGPYGERNCTRDGGGPFGFGNQVLISSHRKLLWSRAVVVLCQEGVRAPCCMRDEGRPFGAAL